MFFVLDVKQNIVLRARSTGLKTIYMIGSSNIHFSLARIKNQCVIETSNCNKTQSELQTFLMYSTYNVVYLYYCVYSMYCLLYPSTIN